MLALWLLPAAPWVPAAAVALGSLAGMALNFVGAKFRVFKSR
jgi:putative flippase GtrA